MYITCELIAIFHTLGPNWCTGGLQKEGAWEYMCVPYDSVHFALAYTPFDYVLRDKFESVLHSVVFSFISIAI